MFPEDKSDETLLSSLEVAEILGITEITLCRWRKAGTGPSYFKIGGKVRYQLGEVKEWFASTHVIAE